MATNEGQSMVGDAEEMSLEDRISRNKEVISSFFIFSLKCSRIKWIRDMLCLVSYLTLYLVTLLDNFTSPLMTNNAAQWYKNGQGKDVFDYQTLYCIHNNYY